MVVRFFSLAAIHSASFWFCSTVIAVSTSTASRLPEISVEEMGDHFISLAPGGRSLVTTGVWALTRTSHCNRLVITPPQFAGSASTAQRCWLSLPLLTKESRLSCRDPSRPRVPRNSDREPEDWPSCHRKCERHQSVRRPAP